MKNGIGFTNLRIQGDPLRAALGLITNRARTEQTNKGGPTATQYGAALMGLATVPFGAKGLLSSQPVNLEGTMNPAAMVAPASAEVQQLWQASGVNLGTLPPLQEGQTMEMPAYLRALAEASGDPTLGAELNRIADAIEQSLRDSDGVITLDDHFMIRGMVRDTLDRYFPADLATRDVKPGDEGYERLTTQRAIYSFLNDLKGRMSKMADIESHTFTPYSLNVVGMPDGTGQVVPTANISGVATSQAYGRRDHFASYIPRERLDNLFPGRFEIAPDQNVVNLDRNRDGQSDGTVPIEVREGDFLYSDLVLIDHANGDKVTTVGQVFEDLRLEMFLQSDLSITARGEVDPTFQINMVQLVEESSPLPVETFTVHMPGYMELGDQTVRGVRPVWVFAEMLADRGLISEFELRAWLANKDDPAVIDEAVARIAPLIQQIEVGTYDSFRQYFYNDQMLNAQTGEGTDLDYFLRHGVLAPAFYKSGSGNLVQNVPDYVKGGSGDKGYQVVTPTGPMMVLFDSVLPQTEAGGNGAFPDDQFYIFGMSTLNVALADGVTLAPQAPTDQRQLPVPTLEQLNASTDSAMNTIGAALVDKTLSDYDAYRELSPQADNLDALVAQQENVLLAKMAQLDAAEKRAGWWSENTFIGDSEQINALEREVSDLQAWLQQARGLQGALHIALAQLAPAQFELTPEQWRTRLDGVQVSGNPSDLSGIQQLILTQEDVKAARIKSLVQQADSAEDLSALRDIVAWYREWAFTDQFLGSPPSPEGLLVRTQKAAAVDQAETIQAFDVTVVAGEARIHSELHRLLMQENPVSPAGGTYVENYTAYQTLKPAFDQLEATMQTAREAQNALNQAESAILYRDLVKMQEPPPYDVKTREVPDGNGGTRTETYNDYSRHQSWEVQYAMAKANAEFWKSSAESAVRELAGQRELLGNELEKLNQDELGIFLSSPLGQVTNGLDWWLVDWTTFGFWSYDGARIDDVQADVDRLIGGLDSVRQVVAPEFHKYEGRVDEALVQRRTELRNQALVQAGLPSSEGSVLGDTNVVTSTP